MKIKSLLISNLNYNHNTAWRVVEDSDFEPISIDLYDNSEHSCVILTYKNGDITKVNLDNVVYYTYEI